MRMIVAAVPGGGKTTILNYVVKKIPEAKIVHMGDLVFEIAKKKFKIKDRDELRQELTIDQQKLVQDNAYKKISKMRQKIIIIDTHFSIKTPSGYFPGITDHTVKMVKPDSIVVLEFSPKDIIERRMKDKSRKRDAETEEQVEEHQRMNRQYASNASALIECPVDIIDLRYKQKKPFEHAVKAANEIVKIIKRDAK